MKDGTLEKEEEQKGGKTGGREDRREGDEMERHEVMEGGKQVLVQTLTDKTKGRKMDK